MAGIFTRKELAKIMGDENLTPEERVDSIFSLYGRSLDDGYVTRGAAQAAQEACRVHLRAKQPFVFNTTSLTPLMRGKSIRLFEQYGARVRIIYLETGWEEQLRRNAARTAAVPESAIDHMLDTLIPPERHEAHSVEWLCV